MIKHMLWWKPGESGRGILCASGLVITWPEDEMEHYDRAYAMNLDVREDDYWFFYIDRDGHINQYCLDPGQADRVLEVSSMFKPPHRWKIAVEAAANAMRERLNNA